MASKNVNQLEQNYEKPVTFRYFTISIPWFAIITAFCLSMLFVNTIPSFLFPNNRVKTFDVSLAHVTVKKPDVCSGKYIYILDLPSEFNTDLLKNCTPRSIYNDACELLENSGLGIRLNSSDFSDFSSSNWFGTDQFSLEVIFHNRMKQYRCLTKDYLEASAVFVPSYSAMDIRRYLYNLNLTLQDEYSVNLAKFISEKPAWRRFHGRDHFLVAARTTWEFHRFSDGYGNRFLQLPEIKNVTSLLLESSPMSLSDFGIPNPTYFHPSSRSEVEKWQNEIRQKRRNYLFSFAGAPRPAQSDSIRNLIIEQCLAATNGENLYRKFLHVTPEVKPETIMKLFQASDFCIQPPGDTFTRKSIFDTIIAGCIPVLFHPGSAYIHYVWHLPKDYSSYSVLIPLYEFNQGNVSIEKVLSGISKEKVLAMREEVIKLIPRTVYANPNGEVDDLEDAFELAVKGVLNRVERVKNGTFDSIPDQLAWKYKFFGDLENHEWDKYFG